MVAERSFPPIDDRVSRNRYIREQRAREEAEILLEERSRALFIANEELSRQSQNLERAVEKRTEELRQALDRAEAAKLAQSRFIATMSHEIRTPLGGLIGMIDLLIDRESCPEKLQFLGHAINSGYALRRIVNDVLDFSKMEAGAFNFERGPVDLRGVVEDVSVLAINITDGIEERLSTEIGEDVPDLIMCDATRIRQVISNLVTNAVRYSVDGPIVVRVKRVAGAQGDAIRIEVQDHGVGLSKSEQERLFKDFTQVSNKLTAAAQGAGLGLAISKRIVEGCGGRIGVESAPRQGSTFWFEIPLEEFDPALGGLPDEAGLPDAFDTSSLEGLRILLVEDNPINRKLIIAYLDRMKVDVEVAENGQIAIEAFSPNRFDLILMDVAMPEMDGLAATRHLRSTWAPEEVPPIALLTAHVLEVIRDECASVGADLVVSKPVTYDELRAAVWKLAGRERVAVSEAGQSSPVAAETPASGIAAVMTPEIAEGLLHSFPGAALEGLVREYLKDGRAVLDAIRRGRASWATDEIASQAHTLKGSSGLLGFAALAELAELLETNAEHLDADEMIEIESCIDEKFDEIEALLSGQA